MHAYESEKKKLQHYLYSALSSIHIVLDLWTSPNHLALLGIIAYYTNEYGILQHSTLVVREVEGQYTGKNLDIIFFKVIQEYSIQSHLGYFIGNNMSNNDTMLEYIAEELAKEGIKYDLI